MRWDHFTPKLDWYTVRWMGDVTAELLVNPVMARDIDGRPTAHPWLFPGRSSAQVSAGRIGQWTTAVAEKAGVERLSPHGLRHTVIATVNNATGDLQAAQQSASHANVETTMIYTRVTAQRSERAVATLQYVA